MNYWTQQLNLPALEQQHNLPSGLLSAVLDAESNGNPNAVSKTGATGLFQFEPDTAKQYGIDPNDPQQAAQGAARMYADLAQKYDNNVPKMLAAYNWGQGNLDKNGLNQAPDETQAYIGKVMTKLGNTSTAPANTKEVTDPAILSQLNAPQEVTDPHLLAQLNGESNESPQTPALAPQGQSQPTPSIADKAGSILSTLAGNTLESAKSAATSTGEAMSEPYDESRTPWPLVPADIFAKTLGKAGNAIGGAFGLATALMTGAMTTVAEPFIPAEAKAIASLTGQNPNLTPQQIHDLARGQGSDLANAAFMGMGAKKGSMLENDIGTKAPAIAGDNPSQPPSQGPLGFLRDTSSGGAGMPGQPGGFPLPKFVVDNTSGSPMPSFLQPAKPLPKSLLTTDTGAPLLVSPKAIPQAHADIAPFLESDGLNLNKVAYQLETAQKTNPNVTALDIMAKDEGGIPGGSNMIGLAKSIAQSPGQGKTLAAEMTGRGYTASQRIGDQFDNLISTGGYYQNAAQFMSDMKDAGSAYDKAYQNPTPMTSPELNKLLTRPAVKTALGKASSLAANEGVSIVTPAKTLNTQGIDYLKRALDDMVETQGKNQFGKTTNEGRIILNLKNQILAEADRINPDFAAARAKFASPATLMERMQEGRKFMGMEHEEIADIMHNKNVPNPEKAAFAVGARRALQDKADLKGEAKNPINAMWVPKLKKQLQALSTDQASFDNFAQYMEHEKTMSRVNDALRGGSDTFTKQEFNKTPAKSGLGNAVRAASDPLMFVGGHTADFIDKALTKQAQAMSQNSKTIIMRYLTTKDPALLRDLAAQIGQKPPKTATKP